MKSQKWLFYIHHYPVTSLQAPAGKPLKQYTVNSLSYAENLYISWECQASVERPVIA